MAMVEIEIRAGPTEEELHRAFEEQYREVSFRVVTAYGREGAESLLSEVRGGADMESLARERSVDPYALRGGLVKSLPRGDLQISIADLAFSLDPGQVQEVSVHRLVA